jgi:hypothetical protein
MKHKITFFILFLAFSLLFTVFPSVAQQNKLDPTMRELEDKSIRSLPEGTVYLKSYQADVLGQAQEWVEYSLSLQAGGKYVFSIADLEKATDAGALVFIYDRSQHKMASNFHNEKIYPSFEFHCQGSGVYKLFIAFKNANDKKACVSMAKKIN